MLMTMMGSGDGDYYEGGHPGVEAAEISSGKKKLLPQRPSRSMGNV